MFFTEETCRAVIVAAIQSQRHPSDIEFIIESTVGALIAADRKLYAHAYSDEAQGVTPEAQQSDADTEQH